TGCPPTICGLDIASFDNTIDQTNEQQIEDVDDGSEATNEAENRAVIGGSDILDINDNDNNNVNQDNNQNIEDVDDGSEANNRAENDAEIGDEADNNDIEQSNDQK
ncbi:MAG: hypothetical protein ACRD5B_17990, partial [Nitrososphaeraceae archaeon]